MREIDWRTLLDLVQFLERIEKFRCEHENFPFSSKIDFVEAMLCIVTQIPFHIKIYNTIQHIVAPSLEIQVIYKFPKKAQTTKNMN